ncbi:uncharacterized protein LOC131800622 [Musca domestica]|uniref:Uncharacterized protein LOC131800622 n=1 Tax=Musca domestica TaxID=7370 RepID=A0ABM3UKQ6_MUSDO|nr:uncharacterized protein LOC131800622 [Musca domestica]
MIRILGKQKNGLKLVHINAQSLNNKLDEFEQLFVSSNVDLICVSETWFHSDVQDGIYNIPGYTLFRADRKTFAGGSCIYVRSGIKCKVKLKSDNCNSNEYIFLELILRRNQKCLVGCVYRPNKQSNVTELISELQNISMSYEDVIICGDFNSNILVEKSLTDEFEALDLYPINSTCPTHYHSTSSSLIDIIFLNQLSKLLLYDQLSAPMFSKHDLLYMIYDVNVSCTEECITYRDFKRINYNMLDYHLLSINWNEVYTLADVNDQVLFLQDKCNVILNDCVPLKTITPKNNTKPWFNSQIKRLINERDASYKRWKKFKTPDFYEHFKSLRRETTSKIQKAKATHYKNQFSTAVNSKSKWKRIREIGIGQAPRSSSHEDIDIDALNMKFTGNNSVNISENVYSNLNIVRNDNEFSFRCVEQDDIYSAFREISSNAEVCVPGGMETSKNCADSKV